MRLLLISRTAVVIQIFDLICKKLDLEYCNQNHLQVDEHYDFIIIDRDFIDDQFNIIKQYSKRLGAIYHEELPFEKARDFVIPRPFLPNQLYAILDEHIQMIKEEKVVLSKDSHESVGGSEEESVLEYIESLEEEPSPIIEGEIDESLIKRSSLNDGGILDHNELDKIQDILTLNTQDIHENSVPTSEDEDWTELSDIIDQAIHEAQSYEFSKEDNLSEELFPIVWYKHNLPKLKPLLDKLDPYHLDQFYQGNSIAIELQLKEK